MEEVARIVAFVGGFVFCAVALWSCIFWHRYKSNPKSIAPIWEKYRKKIYFKVLVWGSGILAVVGLGLFLWRMIADDWEEEFTQFLLVYQTILFCVGMVVCFVASILMALTLKKSRVKPTNDL